MLIMLLMAIDSGSAKTSDANLTSLVGMFFVTDVFWNSDISGWF